MRAKIVPHLSRDEYKLIELYRQSVPSARWIIRGQAEAMAKASGDLRGPLPGKVVPFPQPERRQQ